MMEDVKTIKDWFDPHSPEHLEAFKEMSHTGMWPKYFIPDDIHFGSFWRLELLELMANAWMDSQIKCSSCPCRFEDDTTISGYSTSGHDGSLVSISVLQKGKISRFEKT